MRDEPDHEEAVTPLAGAIRGEVTYRERMLPRPGSTVVVTLEDTSRVGAPAEVIATDTIEVTSGPPWRFLLTFEPRAMDARHSYSIRARLLTRDGSLQFTSTDVIPAFDRTRQGPIEVVMSQAGGGPRGARGR